jgi:hypothetical protein
MIKISFVLLESSYIIPSSIITKPTLKEDRLNICSHTYISDLIPTELRCL